jgi:hypothetical protein
MCNYVSLLQTGKLRVCTIAAKKLCESAQWWHAMVTRSHVRLSVSWQVVTGYWHVHWTVLTDNNTYESAAVVTLTGRSCMRVCHSAMWIYSSNDRQLCEPSVMVTGNSLSWLQLCEYSTVVESRSVHLLQWWGAAWWVCNNDDKQLCESVMVVIFAVAWFWCSDVRAQCRPTGV